MMKKMGVCTALYLLTASHVTFSSKPTTFFAPDMSNTGLFVKCGENYNPIKFDQYLKPTGASNIYSRSSLAAFGASGGPANPYHATQSTFSPETQMGYFKHFTSSDKLWGVKFLSNYLGIISTDQDIDSFRSRSFTNNKATFSDSFKGNVTQTSINHELALLAYIGHSFTNSHVYLGAGPSLFGAKSHFYDVTGYADSKGAHVDYTGSHTTMSNSKWMWGGAAQMGMTYYINPTWVLDLSYTYAMTGLYSAINGSSSFANLVNNYSSANMSYANNYQRVSAQAVTVSFNKVFSLF